MGTYLNGLPMLYPTFAFWLYGRILSVRKEDLELRPMALALATLSGLMTGGVMHISGGLLSLVLAGLAAVASSRLIWRSPRAVTGITTKGGRTKT